MNFRDMLLIHDEYLQGAAAASVFYSENFSLKNVEALREN